MRQTLRLAHHDHLSLCHHGVSLGRIDDFLCGGLCAVEDSEIDIPLVLSQGLLDDIIRDAVNVIGLLAHQTIDGFEGVEEAIRQCDDKIEEINSKLFMEAESLQKEGKWNEAILAYSKVNGYKDSEERIAYCKQQIFEEAYEKAQKLQNEKKYERRDV